METSVWISANNQRVFYERTVGHGYRRYNISSIRAEVWEWLEAQDASDRIVNYMNRGTSFHFTCPKVALMFKLTWGGND